jgi:hypothetical protein
MGQSNSTFERFYVFTFFSGSIGLDPRRIGQYRPLAMFYLRGTACAFLLLLAAMPLAAREPVLTPQQGVLLLRNGNVIEGQVTRAGDYYIVTFGENGEARLSATDVETLCVDLEDAYRFRKATMVGQSAASHLTWLNDSLRHDLKAQAGEQLLEAMHKEPAHPRVAAIERKLKLAQEAPSARSVRQPDTAATVSAEQLDKTIRTLPPGTIERFSAVVQPILLNRCAAGGCHGATAKSEFRLLRPPPGQTPSKRFTQRNLYAVLAYLDRENPEESPLLALPQGQHGTTVGRVFDKRTEHQRDDLVAWAKLALAVPAPAPPATIVRAQALLSQQNEDRVSAANANNRVPAAADDGQKNQPGTPPQQFTPPKDAAPIPREGAFKPRDAFDPEIFNRQFLPGTTGGKMR